MADSPVTRGWLQAARAERDQIKEELHHLWRTFLAGRPDSDTFTVADLRQAWRTGPAPAEAEDRFAQQLTDAITPGDRLTRCRYLTRGKRGALDRCTAEAVEDNAEIQLCARHLAAALELLNRRGAIR